MRVRVFEFRCPICHGEFLAQKDISRPVTCADCAWRGSYEDSASVRVDTWEFGAQMVLPWGIQYAELDS